MATVYRAVDTRLDRTVAVKVMPAHLAADTDFAARFVREARAAARLTHPGVVGLLAQGDDDGLVYLAMEYVRGRTLRDGISDEAPLPPVRAVRLVERVVDALAAAHTAKIVHRDVKPENVMLALDGRAMVADFGVARDAAGAGTVTGAFVGNAAYGAPEQALGIADHRSDIYSLGAVLYHMVAGVPPFTGSPYQLMRQHESQPPPELPGANA